MVCFNISDLSINCEHDAVGTTLALVKGVMHLERHNTGISGMPFTSLKFWKWGVNGIVAPCYVMSLITSAVSYFHQLTVIYVLIISANSSYYTAAESSEFND